MMKKGIIIVALLPLLIIALGGVSQAWQGRMAGMGDPYGLVSDESTFLIHPAKLAKGEGVRFYGNYRFTYTGLANWGLGTDTFDAAGTLLSSVNYDDDSGDEYGHDALLGAVFPLGPGRMGLFFEYTGMRGNKDLDQVVESFPGPIITYYENDVRNELDDFAVRLLYGLPMDGINLGGEVQFSYRQEQSTFWYQITDLSLGSSRPYFYWRFTPYDDSDYWEALLKGSVEGMIGPLDLEFTLRGGFIFAGDNAYDFETQIPVGTTAFAYDLDGEVNGWQIGGDLWARYPISGDLALPFLVRVDYQEKTWDGDGPGGIGYVNNDYFDYERERRDLTLTVGGGVDKELNAGTRIAGGIYYGYIQNHVSRYFMTTSTLGWSQNDNNNAPLHTEHQVMVRFAGEHEFSPVVALRMGLEFFYGWVKEDVEITNTSPGFTNTLDYSFNGCHWGIGASIGGSVRFDGFVIEPFVNAGYQSLDQDGDGENVINNTLTYLYERDETLSEWYIGGGVSFLYDLP